jgi:ketosteroid isomerase-like protein
VKPLLLLLPAALFFLSAVGGPARDDDPEAEIEAVLDDYHAAAAEGDVERMLGHIAPDAVLLGTDATERWTRESFEQLVRPAMAGGARIVNVPSSQNIVVSASDGIAWFDERLERHEFGEMRGTGVLRRTTDGWKIVQFHTALTVPNEAFRDVVKIVRAAKKR